MCVESSAFSHAAQPSYRSGSQKTRPKSAGRRDSAQRNPSFCDEIRDLEGETCCPLKFSRFFAHSRTVYSGGSSSARLRVPHYFSCTTIVTAALPLECTPS